MHTTSTQPGYHNIELETEEEIARKQAEKSASDRKILLARHKTILKKKKKTDRLVRDDSDFDASDTDTSEHSVSRSAPTYSKVDYEKLSPNENGFVSTSHPPIELAEFATQPSTANNGDDMPSGRMSAVSFSKNPPTQIPRSPEKGPGIPPPTLSAPALVLSPTIVTQPSYSNNPDETTADTTIDIDMLVLHRATSDSVTRQKRSLWARIKTVSPRKVLTDPWMLFSMATALGTGINALVGPSGKKPGDIPDTWWGSMTDKVMLGFIPLKIFSIVSGAASFIVNTVLSADFIPKAFADLKKSCSSLGKLCKTKCRKACKHPLRSFLDWLAFFSGTCAALSAAVITYTSLEWLAGLLNVTVANVIWGVTGFQAGISSYLALRKKGYSPIKSSLIALAITVAVTATLTAAPVFLSYYFVALPAAFYTLSAYMAQRYKGMKDFFQKVLDLCDKNKQFQYSMMEDVYNLNAFPEKKANMNAVINHLIKNDREIKNEIEENNRKILEEIKKLPMESMEKVRALGKNFDIKLTRNSVTKILCAMYADKSNYDALRRTTNNKAWDVWYGAKSVAKYVFITGALITAAGVYLTFANKIPVGVRKFLGSTITSITELNPVAQAFTHIIEFFAGAASTCLYAISSMKFRYHGSAITDYLAHESEEKGKDLGLTFTQNVLINLPAAYSMLSISASATADPDFLVKDINSDSVQGDVYKWNGYVGGAEVNGNSANAAFFPIEPDLHDPTFYCVGRWLETNLLIEPRKEEDDEDEEVNATVPTDAPNAVTNGTTIKEKTTTTPFQENYKLLQTAHGMFSGKQTITPPPSAAPTPIAPTTPSTEKRGLMDRAAATPSSTPSPDFKELSPLRVATL